MPHGRRDRSRSRRSHWCIQPSSGSSGGGAAARSSSTMTARVWVATLTFAERSEALDTEEAGGKSSTIGRARPQMVPGVVHERCVGDGVGRVCPAGHREYVDPGKSQGDDDHGRRDPAGCEPVSHRRSLARGRRWCAPQDPTGRGVRSRRWTRRCWRTYKRVA